MPLISDPTLFDADRFDSAIENTDQSLPIFQQALKKASAELKQRFLDNVDVQELVFARAWVMDNLLGRAYRLFINHDQFALVAVGGYGRGELHPGSDIDIMLLLPEEGPGEFQDKIEHLLTFLWDLRLDVGHSVRTVSQCIQEAKQDITIATNLMEARLIAGAQPLFQTMREAAGSDRIWSSREFFEAKWQEQIARHHKFDDTAYNLEPNIKEGPGGLRDIQMIGWVAKRHFGVQTLHGLVEHKFLTQDEYDTLIAGQNFLWKIRFGLHTLTGRREDRLLFDHQRALASQFGYQDDGKRLAVEHFMKQYYRTIMELGRLNEMLLQLFQEAILYAKDSGEPVAINRRFQARKGFIEATNKFVFKNYPFALLEIFLILAQHRELKGVRARTIRLIRDHCTLIDDKFRDDLRCRSLFMEILRQPEGVTQELRRMNRYGVLASYLPVFGNIVGQMQHDLFHHYTVDEHTMFVIRNLRRFTIRKHANELPLCSKIIRSIPKVENLYLAALFHDIAKGRGGDHSELGAEDAIGFCRKHGLSEYDTKLVAWLVRHHLLMSVTAQRKDISDPEVINTFAATVANQLRLDYLYLLTIADIRATNPSLWNSWKDALLTDLYLSTTRVLRRGLENPLDKQERIANAQESARKILHETTQSKLQAIDTLWKNFGDDYFLRHSADRIAWHTEVILDSRPEDLPLVLVYPREKEQRGGTEIFIYGNDQDHLFASVTAAIDLLGLNVVEARIITTLDGYTLDTYIVLEETGEYINNPRRIQEIAHHVREKLVTKDTKAKRVKRHLPRQLKHFPIKTEVAIRPDPNYPRTIVEVLTSDRPGVLSLISQGFVSCEVRLRNAKVATFGERVEDIFFITDQNNQPLHDEQQIQCLKETIISSLTE